jgi:hypothetical protein
MLRTKQMESPLAASNIFIVYEILSTTEPHATIFEVRQGSTLTEVKFIFLNRG